MKPDVMILVSFDLFMFRDSSFELKLEISVTDHELITFPIKFIELTRIIFFSSLKLFKFLLKSYFHLSCIFSILIKQILKMFNNILFREIINSICLVHIKCISSIYKCILLNCLVNISCHH